MFHSRQIEYRKKEYEIQIPEIWLPGENNPHMVIFAEYLLSRRRYPLQVYLFALNEYCNDRGASQRDIAKKTRERYGLGTFAHTTLGRALKRLHIIINTIEQTVQNSNEEDGGADGCEKTNDESPAGSQGYSSIDLRREHVRLFFNEWLPQATGADQQGFECRATKRMIVI